MHYMKGDDYKFLFTSTLHSELKNRVKGHVYCRVGKDDVLKIVIQMDEENYPYDFFDMYVLNFSIKILHGLTVSEMVHIVMKNYRRHINDKYFK